MAVPEPDPAAVAAEALHAAEPVSEWKVDKAGNQYIGAVGRKGVIRRRGDESIADALARDQRPKDKAPKAKATKTAPIPDKPKDVDLRELEEALVGALRSPAMVAGLAGDEWLANHFTIQAPALARNLVVASESNPWLRRQLEGMAAGGNSAMMIVSLLGLAGAFAAYLAPPIIYLFNLPVPDRARAMFAIPARDPQPVPEPEFPRAVPDPAAAQAS